MPETKITADELLSGQIRTRQGGDPDDFTVPGTTNYEEQRSNMQTFFGAATSVSGTVTVTFPLPFAQKPIVLGNLLGILTPNLTVLWYAVGRRPMS